MNFYRQFSYRAVLWSVGSNHIRVLWTDKYLSMLAEFCSSSNCFHFKFSRYNYNRTTHMEINQGLVSCQHYICWNAGYKYV